MAIEELLGQLTLEEKCSLLSGSAFWYTQAVEDLGIRRLMLTDGPHGLRKQVENADHLGLNKSVPATCFPPAAALAASWNEELIYEMGEALGIECRAENVDVLLGPGGISNVRLCADGTLNTFPKIRIWLPDLQRHISQGCRARESALRSSILLRIIRRRGA